MLSGYPRVLQSFWSAAAIATEKYMLPDSVTDFSVLYKDNCAGCHGAERPLWRRPPAERSALSGCDRQGQMRDVIAKGVPGTAMPAFAQNGGGTLTDQQITILADQIEARWSRPQDYAGVTLPPYSADLGDARRGEAVFKTPLLQMPRRKRDGRPR